MKTQQNKKQFSSSPPHLSLHIYPRKPHPCTFLSADIVALSCFMSACKKNDYRPAATNNMNKAAGTSPGAASAAVATNNYSDFDYAKTLGSPCNGVNVMPHYSIAMDLQSVINNNSVAVNIHTLITYQGSGDKGSAYKSTGSETVIENGPLRRAQIYLNVKANCIFSSVFI